MKKLNTAGLATATKSAKASHPIVTVDDDTQTLLGQFVRVNPEFKKLKGQQESLSKQIGERIKRIYYATFAGRNATSSTLLAYVGETPVKMTMKDAYSKKLETDAQLRVVLGKALVDRWFHFATLFTIDFDKMPEVTQEKFADAVIELAQTHGVGEAVIAKQYIAPRAGFHEARTALLTPEQNIAVEELIPTTAFPQL